MRVKTSGLLVTAAIVATLALSGCGGGAPRDTARNDQNQAGQQDENETTGHRITMGSGEFYFEPADVTVKRGETVTIVLSNDGAIAHNISVDEFNVDETYDAGRTVNVTFTPDKAGTYRMYCDEPGHTEAGMVGTLTVE